MAARRRLCSITLILATLVSTADVTNGVQQLRVVCYMASWARYRQAPVRFEPEDVDTSLCTHVNVAFANLDSEGANLVPASTDDPALYQRLTSLKREAPDMKVMLSVGGRDANTATFRALVASESNMRSFATSAIAFLRRYNFDGLDISWEEDSGRFTQLLQVLHSRFRDYSLLLSVAMPSFWTSSKLPEIASYVDFLNVLTYDLHGSWDGMTGHHSALYSPTHEDDSVDYAINRLLNESVPADKMTMGLPMYGRSFTLQDPANTGLGSPTTGPGAPGTLTRMGGSLAYYEICKLLTESGDNVTSGTLPNGDAPYIVDGSRWTGYDDPTSIKEKIEYVKRHGLGGVNIWTIDMDDFHGICGQGHYPLLHVIHDNIGLVG